MQSGGGGIQLFLSPGTTGRLRLRNCGRVAARPGAVRLAQPQDDGSLAFQLPLDMGPARGAAPVVGLGLGPADGPAAQQQAPPPSRLQRAAQEAPPPGNAVMTASRGGAAAGTDIVLDAGGCSGHCRLHAADAGWMSASLCLCVLRGWRVWSTAEQVNAGDHQDACWPECMPASQNASPPAMSFSLTASQVAPALSASASAAGSTRCGRSTRADSCC